MTARPADTANPETDRLDDDGSPVLSAANEEHPVERLVWATAPARARLDGAWWPRSGDAVAELAALVPAVSEHLGGPVSRVSLNIDAWGHDQPRRLRVGTRLVRLGWFHTLDSATVTLARTDEDRITLLVIPPGLAPAVARDLLRRLSTATTWPDSATSALTGAWPGDGTADRT